MKAYETVIGLEVHVELSTKSKIFCGCSTAFGGAPNTHCCPVCTGMPGTLPVLNKKVVEYALAAGIAMNCEVTQNCKFDRKNYFYPDLPKAYQTSQLYLPICHDGHVDIEVNGIKKVVRIHEIHMEEDAGKLIHDPWSDSTLVDYNRCGVPLIEIVSEPDLRSAEEVIAYLEKLKLIMSYLNVSDCKMQEGSIRADINLSVREMGAQTFGTRTEMKNMNSFKAIARAIEGERQRQIDRLEEKKVVIQETRRWDDNKDASFAMRNKEDAQDYRYFPEPDLVPIVISNEWIQAIKDRQPELKDEKKIRYCEEFHLPEYDAEILTSNKHLADIFEETVKLYENPKEVSNWLMVEMMRILKEDGQEPENITLSSADFAQLLIFLKDGKINRAQAKEIFEQMIKNNVSPEDYIKAHNMTMECDETKLKEVILSVIAENPQSVSDYQAGKKKAAGFLVGATMKKLQGKADPAAINKLLLQLL